MEITESGMTFQLSEDAKLFTELETQRPAWWKRLIEDKEFYVDIRKDKGKAPYINVYYMGGSLMRLWYGRDRFEAEISSEYIPLSVQSKPIRYTFAENGVSFGDGKIGIAPIDNFCDGWLSKAKKRIGLFNRSDSEKAIQADYVLHNPRFIDTEFQVSQNARIDLVWLEVPENRIYFVELKTIGDSRIYFDEDVPPDQKIHGQLKKYKSYLTDNRDKLPGYYAKLYGIKKRLGLLAKDWDEVGSIADFTIEPKPILLIGDCTENWIKKYSGEMNAKIADCAYGAIYHGRNTTTFAIPRPNRRHEYVSSCGGEGQSF